MKLLTADEMRELDRRTIEEVGIPGVILMEHAGAAAARILAERFAALKPGPVLVLAGKGNNGGDGYVIARHLLNAGWRVRTVVLCAPEAVAGDTAVNLVALRGCRGEVVFAPDAETLEPILAEGRDAVLVVDALFGTGLSSPVRGHYARAIDWINESGRPVLAVDVPSGIDATSGASLGHSVQADLTVTFAAAKLGQVVYPGAAAVGELVPVDIGIPPWLAAETGDAHLLVDAAHAAALLPPRPATGHKGTFGHLLVLAGSVGKAGAAALTAAGGLRGGAGLVTVGCPASVQETLAIKLTEAMTEPLSETDGALGLQALEAIRSLWADKRAVALGPGLGLAAETKELVLHLVRECPHPLVLDADGLNAVAEGPEVLLERQAATILTPHPGEMARLCGTSVADVEADRVAVARRFAERFGVTLVLKGARTVIALADGRVRINGSGNPGMAAGGMGDALTGLLGALLAQGMFAEDAAVLGVFLHGLAADRLRARFGEAGMLAGEVAREFPAARLSL